MVSEEEFSAWFVRVAGRPEGAALGIVCRDCMRAIPVIDSPVNSDLNCRCGSTVTLEEIVSAHGFDVRLFRSRTRTDIKRMVSS